MIPVSCTILDSNHNKLASKQQGDWQKQLSSGIKSVSELLQYLGLDSKNLPYAIDSNAQFKTKVTRHFADLIDTQNPYDPILLQILPRAEEQLSLDGFTPDPLAESDFSPTQGLIHKYHNRVLLIAHQNCALHCRYCFRRHYPYQDQRLTPEAFEQCLNYIRQHSNINEVILSGGDPLSLSDKNLTEILQSLDSLEQVSTIRIHSRTPVALPDRISAELLDAFRALNKKIVMVIHVNHANEISSELAEKLHQLKQAGVLLLNQSVLLKDINDRADIQVELCEKLFSNGVIPYYLHSLDPVSGTHHFQVSAQRQLDIWNGMQSKLSGYLLPRLVQELPYKNSKTWINTTNLENTAQSDKE